MASVRRGGPARRHTRPAFTSGASSARPTPSLLSKPSLKSPNSRTSAKVSAHTCVCDPLFFSLPLFTRISRHEEHIRLRPKHKGGWQRRQCPKTKTCAGKSPADHTAVLRPACVRVPACSPPSEGSILSSSSLHVHPRRREPRMHSVEQRQQTRSSNESLCPSPHLFLPSEVRQTS